MRKLMLMTVVVLAALPAIALASSSTAQSAAQKQCRQEQSAMGKATFKLTFGTNANRSNAFGKCVSHRTSQNSAAEKSAQKNAAKQCTAEQSDPNFASTHNGKTFDQFYGTPPKFKNAFGKCVSTKAKAMTSKTESSEVSAEINAAKQCRAEQAKDPAAFKNKYGTNANKSNAFGKCVSTKAKAQEHGSSS